MKRKYPITLFLLGMISNAIRYFVIGLLGIVFVFIGLFAGKGCMIFGLVTLMGYVILCFVEQIKIRNATINTSGNPEVDKLLDAILGGEYEEDKFTYKDIINRDIYENSENSEKENKEDIEEKK